MNLITEETCFWCGTRVPPEETYKVEIYEKSTTLFICKTCIKNNPRLAMYIDSSVLSDKV
jgi:hypothetical protein